MHVPCQSVASIRTRAEQCSPTPTPNMDASMRKQKGAAGSPAPHSSAVLTNAQLFRAANKFRSVVRADPCMQTQRQREGENRRETQELKGKGRRRKEEPERGRAHHGPQTAPRRQELHSKHALVHIHGLVRKREREIACQASKINKSHHLVERAGQSQIKAVSLLLNVCMRLYCVCICI